MTEQLTLSLFIVTIAVLKKKTQKTSYKHLLCYHGKRNRTRWVCSFLIVSILPWSGWNTLLLHTQNKAKFTIRKTLYTGLTQLPWTVCVCVCVCVCACMCAQSCLTLWEPTDCIAHQAPLSVGFSRQKYWSGLPFPTPGDLPNPEIKPVSLASPALAGGFFTAVPSGNKGKKHIHNRLMGKEWAVPKFPCFIDSVKMGTSEPVPFAFTPLAGLLSLTYWWICRLLNVIVEGIFTVWSVFFKDRDICKESES